MKNDFPAPPEPFIRRTQFRASLETEGRTAHDLELVLDFDELGRNGPKGWVLGNNESCARLKHIFPQGHLPWGVSVRSLDGTRRATIDFLATIQRGEEIGPTGVVATFSCRSLTIDDSLDFEPSESRSVTFVMVGPHHHWESDSSRDVSYTGKAEVAHHDAALSIPTAFPANLEVRPHFYYSPGGEPTIQITAETLSITAATQVQRTTLSDDAFLQGAIELVDDASLLVSFISGSWVTWHSYHFMSGDRFVEHVRSARRGRQVNPQDTPIGMRCARKFLAIAVPRLQRMRADGREPRLAILHTVAARESLSSEERFSRFFMALESLKDLHSAQTGRERILGAALFDRVRAAIGEAIVKLEADGRLTDKQAASIKRKLPDLNRPTFAEQLETLLAEHGVVWRDLYPAFRKEPDAPPFVSVRNMLMHTGTVASAERLGLETIRVQAVVERLLLRMLGWEDTFSAPRPWWHQRIRARLGDPLVDQAP